MKKFYFLALVLLGLSATVTAQNDCCTADGIGGGLITIGGNSGNGMFESLSSCSCLATNEHDSYWFAFTCSTGGTFEMMITPSGYSADFDFALYANECPCGSGTTVVSCDYTGPITPPGPFVETGISSNPPATFGVPGATEFQPTVILTAGTTYYLIADNITSNGAGFTIQFAGTAAFGPPSGGGLIPPAPLTGAQTACPGATVDYSVPSNPNFSSYNWLVTPSSAIIGANGGNTTDVTYTATGTYTLCVEGIASCVTSPQTCVTVEVTDIVTQPVTDVICTGGSYLGPDGVTYSAPGSYTMFFTSYQGCDSNVTLILTPVTFSNTILTQEICDGDCYTFGNQILCGTGIYQDVLTNYLGCDSIVTLNLIVIPNEAVITGDGAISCTTGVANLSGSNSYGGANLTYQWTNQNGVNIGNLADIIVTNAGTYTLTISSMVGNSICTDQADITVTANAPPNASATGGTISCTATTVTLMGNSTTAGATFGWTGPGGYTSNQQNPTVTVIGTYQLTVTGPNGCTATATAAVTGNAGVPNASATGGMLDCDTPTTNLQGGSTTPNVTWAWTGPNGYSSNQQNPTGIAAAGTYVLTVTAQNGCSAQASATVTLDNAAPNANAAGSGTLTCTTNSLTLQGSSTTTGVTFSWTGPGGFTSSQQNPSVTVAGTYVLTVTGTNGCTATDDVVVTSNVAVPNISAAGGTLDCDNPTLILQGGSTTTGVSFAWTGPGGFISTNEDPSVSMPGTYSLTVTATNGCTATATAIVDQDIVLPNASATGGSLTCTSGTVMITGNSTSPGVTFGWTGPGGYTSASQNPTVSAAGTYVLTVTSANGCTATATAVVQQDAGQPDVFASAGDSLDCVVSSVTLTGGSATSGATILWSGPGGFTSTSPNPVVTAGGQYTLTVTAPNSCTSQALATVLLNNQPPNVQASGATLTCVETSVDLVGSSSTSGTTFEWVFLSDGTVVGNTPSITVSQAGSYQLTVSGANGCTASATAVVDANAGVPDISAVGGDLNCSQTSVALNGGSATPGVSFEWTGPNGFVANQSDTVASLAGTYVFVVTSANGCSAQSQVVVNSDTQLPNVQANGGILSCGAMALSLAGISSTAGVTWSWTGPGGFTSTQQNPSVTVPGNYLLTVTAPNGCTAADNATVAQDANAPIATATGGILTCVNTSVQLMGGSSSMGVTWSWMGPGGFISNQQNPTVTMPGNYVLTITAGNGCVGNASAQVDLNNSSPNATATGGTLTCTSQGITLAGNSTTPGVTFAWAGPGGFTSTDQNPSIATAGTYVLTVTATNGCTATASAAVNNNSNAPNISATAPNLNCNVQSITLNGGSTTPSVTFAWTGPGGFTSSQSDPTTTEPGTYVFTVTAPNGCSATASVDVAEDITVPNVAAVGGNITCADPNLQLQGSSTTQGVTWAWLGPNGYSSSQQNPTITQGGTYTLTVTGNNGCTASANAQVMADAGIPTVTALGGTISCTVDTVQLMGTSSLPNVTWAWTGPGGFSSSAQNPTTTAPGLYSLIVTTSAGCSATVTTTIVDDTDLPTVTVATPNELDCVTPTLNLDGTGSSTGAGYSLVWTTVGGHFAAGENSLSPTVDAAGTYVLSITGPNGCSATATVEVELSEASPNGAVLSVNSPDCFGDTNGSIQVNQVTGGTPPYLYAIDNQSLAAGNSFVNLQPGNYSLTVSDATGCTWQTTVTLNAPVLLDVSLDTDLGANELLLGDSVELQATVSVSASQLETINWTPTEAAANCNHCLNLTVAPTVTTTYVLTIADSNGCEATDQVIVVVDPGKDVYVPNAFSPNDDGINDLLTIFGNRSVAKIKSFVVLSRWGETIWKYRNFQPNDPAIGWDGKHRGKYLDVGVFTWLAEVEFVDGKVALFKGDVTLLKQ